MKTISQMSSERHLLIAILKRWVTFGKNAQFAPPKAYYQGLNQLTKESENAVVFCTTEPHSDIPVPPRETVVRHNRQKVEA